jgi:hypothetical protein
MAGQLMLLLSFLSLLPRGDAIHGVPVASYFRQHDRYGPVVTRAAVKHVWQSLEHLWDELVFERHAQYAVYFTPGLGGRRAPLAEDEVGDVTRLLRDLGWNASFAALRCSAVSCVPEGLSWWEGGAAGEGAGCEARPCRCHALESLGADVRLLSAGRSYAQRGLDEFFVCADGRWDAAPDPASLPAFQVLQIDTREQEFFRPLSGGRRSRLK